eukprot:COSAG02_NODE_289_length_25587_cov_34.270323_11_plen_298_part_00
MKRRTWAAGGNDALDTFTQFCGTLTVAEFADSRSGRRKVLTERIPVVRLVLASRPSYSFTISTSAQLLQIWAVSSPVRDCIAPTAQTSSEMYYGGGEMVLTIPAPAEHPVTRLNILGNNHLIGDEANHPVIRARSHSVPIAVCCLRVAWQLPIVEVAGRLERVTGSVVYVATAAMSTVSSLRCGVWVQASSAILNARDRIPCPHASLRPGTFIDENWFRNRQAQCAVSWCRWLGRPRLCRHVFRVPNERLLRLVEGKWHLLETLLRQLLVRLAQPVAVPAAMLRTHAERCRRESEHR